MDSSSYFFGDDTLSLSALSPKQLYHTRTPERKSTESPEQKSDTNDDDDLNLNLTTNHQQIQLLHWINHSLQTQGSAIIEDATTPLSTLQIIYQLLNQRKTDSDLISTARLEANKANHEKARLTSDKHRLRTQLNLMEKEVASSKHTLKNSYSAAKKSIKQHQEIKNDLEIKLKKLKARDTSYVSKQRKSEVLIEQLKQRITKLMKQKSSSPRNLPRNSNGLSSPRISLRQSKQWLEATDATTATATTATTTNTTTATTTTTNTTSPSNHSLASSIHNNLEAMVGKIHVENKELREHLKQYAHHFNDICSRTQRIERLWLTSNVRDTEMEMEMDTEIEAASHNMYILPLQWVRNDMHTTKQKWKDLKHRISHLEKEMMQQTDTTEQDLEREQLEILLHESKNIIYFQDDLIQSQIAQRYKARKMLVDRKAGSIAPLDWIKSNAFGQLSPLDVESLLLEEEEIVVTKSWLNEERLHLLDERGKMELQRLKRQSI